MLRGFFFLPFLLFLSQVTSYSLGFRGPNSILISKTFPGHPRVKVFVEQVILTLPTASCKQSSFLSLLIKAGVEIKSYID